MASNSFSTNSPNLSSNNNLNRTTSSISNSLINSNSDSNITPSTQPPSYPQSTSVSPGLIALIVIIPVVFTALTLVYWHRRLWRKTSRDGQLPTSSQPGHVTMVLPPGGTGADRPEGQRRSDRMRRLMSGGRGRRPSRSESVRTVPE